MKIKSKKSGIIAKHNNPTFNLTFGEDPIEVTDEVGEVLLKNKDQFEEVKGVDKEAERENRKSSFKKIDK